MLEREVKLGAGPAFHLPDLSGVLDGVTVTPPEAVRLETVYYDTPDLRLARWGVSLRHRAGEGWTLKLPPAAAAGQPPGQLLERDEITFQGGSKKPPEGAVAIVRAYVRKAELVPVARLSTIRRRVRLVDAAGTRVAEVVDDEVSVRDGRRVAARFREIEVEVTQPQNGAGGIVDPLVMRLRGAGAGAPDPTPKHIRALGPRAMEPPEVSAQPVRPDSPAKDVIKHMLAESIASLLKHDPLVRTSGDPEAVHQARVATRKRPEVGQLALAHPPGRDRDAAYEADVRARLAPLRRPAREARGRVTGAGHTARCRRARVERAASAGGRPVEAPALGCKSAARDTHRSGAAPHPYPGQARALRRGGGGAGRRQSRGGVRARGRQAADGPWRAPGQRHRAGVAARRPNQRPPRLRRRRAHRHGAHRGRRRASEVAEGLERTRPEDPARLDALKNERKPRRFPLIAALRAAAQRAKRR